VALLQVHKRRHTLMVCHEEAKFDDAIKRYCNPVTSLDRE